MSANKAKIGISFSAAVILILAYLIFAASRKEGKERPEWDNTAAVAVAPVQFGPIELRRTFSGALEAFSKFVVAPKVSGRIESIPVDIADSVDRGDIVVVLDEAEFAQMVHQAEADLAVAEAHLAEAESALVIALRENQRVVTLRDRGIASASEFDNAQAELLAKEAQVKVAQAQLTSAQSALAAARIRLGYTEIAANWNEGDGVRVVAERYVDAGDTVSANEPLLLIVDLNPITAVIHVTERDYGLLEPGMSAQFSADSFPGRSFEGRIERISPVFRENSRQARVELLLENPKNDLKPGMFVRGEISLSQEENATVIPYAAITRRGNETGVFLINEESKTVSWKRVQTGIRDGDTVQILGDALSGRVVTLGQHLIEDGSPVVLPDDKPVVGQVQ